MKKTNNLSLKSLILLLAALGMSCSGPVDAEVDPYAYSGPLKMGAPFVDGAILQRDKPLPIWGWSQPGSQVTVEFKGQKDSVKAGTDGKWQLELDPVKVSDQPDKMVVTSSGGDSEPITISNILVGEVWMASGQSNMQWLAKVSNATLIIEKLKNAAEASGKKAPIREFKVTNYFAHLHPIEHAAGEWSEEYGEFSAIALAFAHKLYEELGVPIGILNCSFSQTAIEAWTPRVGYKDSKLEYNKMVEAQLLETDPATPEHEKAWSDFYAKIMAVVEQNQQIADEGENNFVDLPTNDKPGNMRSNRDATWLFNARLNPVIPYAISGCIWNQGYANMGGGLTYYDNLHALVRGWRTRWNNPELPVYFHQFYSPGNDVDKSPNHPVLGGASEMRLGTWLARDIPHTGMASQIDNQGAIHYRSKVVPGQRLALHALKNQYGKDVVADGPMFKSYEVKGNQLIVSFDHAEGGLVVAEAGSNYLDKKNPESTGFADPKIIENGADQVTLFYLAGEDRVWHPAKVRIDGDKAVVTSSAVKEPRGVAYGTGGVGFQPNLYNKALLPATPFIYYDNELVTEKTWPDSPIKVAGVEIDPSSVGLVYDYRKMPILSAQFRDNAVLQADQPITFWGIAVHPWNEYQEKITGEQVIHFSFNGIEKEIPVTDGMKQWKVTVPAMEASTQPKTLRAALTIDGEVVHERVVENIIIGDVWYVAAPFEQKLVDREAPVKGPVRMMTRIAKGVKSDWVREFSVATSTTPKNRFSSYWGTAAEPGFIANLADAIHAKTGRPVGIIAMDERDLELKHWMDVYSLANAPSLEKDYKDIAAITPGTPYYKKNAERYINAWKKYWGDYIPEMIGTKAVPDEAAWGSYPEFAGKVETDATYYYNCMVACFKRTQFKGIVFVSEASTVAEADGAHFGEQMSALANGWKRHFKGEKDPHFIYTMPSKELAPKISKPEAIKGASTAFTVNAFTTKPAKGEKSPAGAHPSLEGLVEAAVKAVY
jgi:sialate O-acetylesterase